MSSEKIDTKLCDFSNPDDAQAVTTLLNIYIADEMGGGDPLDVDQQALLIEQLAAHPKALVVFGMVGGEYAGMIVSFENFSTFSVKPMINIHDVIVRNEFRGKGVGRQMMSRMVSEAEKRGAARITLEVRHDNTNAQGLYRSFGFRDTVPPMYFWRKDL